MSANEGLLRFLNNIGVEWSEYTDKYEWKAKVDSQYGVYLIRPEAYQICLRHKDNDRMLNGGYYFVDEFGANIKNYLQKLAIRRGLVRSYNLVEICAIQYRDEGRCPRHGWDSIWLIFRTKNKDTKGMYIVYTICEDMFYTQSPPSTISIMKENQYLNEKISEYADTIKELNEKISDYAIIIKKLEKKMHHLENALLYSPGGPMFSIALDNYNSLLAPPE